MENKKWEWNEQEAAIYIYEDDDYKVGPDDHYIVVKVRVKNGVQNLGEAESSKPGIPSQEVP